MEWLVPLLTLCLMEIVLGIDNIVFISILTSRVEESKREFARKVGISLAFILRIALLFSISWVMTLVDPWFTIFEKTITGRDFILLFGGLFLVWKSTTEIHNKIEGENGDDENKVELSFGKAIVQILLLDIVFSFDSVITAVGMVDQVWIMVVAMVIALIVMLVSVGSISNFVMRHPTVKMLALSFLLLIGVMLVVEGWGEHVPKGYIYFAMAFSLGVELLNMMYRKKRNRKNEG